MPIQMRSGHCFARARWLFKFKSVTNHLLLITRVLVGGDVLVGDEHWQNTYHDQTTANFELERAEMEQVHSIRRRR